MKFTTFSAITIAALASLAVARPTPDDASANTNVVPIRWNDVEAGADAAQSSASASVSAAAAAAAAVDASATASPDIAARHAPPVGNGHGQSQGHKSGAEGGGFHGGSNLWGRNPEPEPDPKKKPDHKLEGTNPFDEGGDHKNDPSWG